MSINYAVVTRLWRWRECSTRPGRRITLRIASFLAAAGPRARLKFYWAINGTPTWHPETVAPPGSVGYRSRTCARASGS
jgi:hypothetical protein